MEINNAVDTLIQAIDLRMPDDKEKSKLPADTEKQLKLFEMFMNRCTAEEGYVIATLGIAIRLNRVADLWEVITPLSKELSAELEHLKL